MTAAPMQLDPALPPEMVFGQLDAVVRQLVETVHTLYAGSWDDCAEDLRRRQAGRPYLFRLTVDCPDALGWLGRLHAYELARGECLPIAAATGL